MNIEQFLHQRLLPVVASLYGEAAPEQIQLQKTRYVPSPPSVTI